MLANVSVIVVNYNSGDVVERCLLSILSQQGISCEIIVVDNASQDNSKAVLEKYKDKVKIIFNEENLGFGKANNVGFKEAKGNFIFLLNPDASFKTSYDLKNMVSFSSQNPQCGLIVPKVLREDGNITEPKLRYTGEKNSDVSGQLPGKWAWALGAAMLIPRNVYQKINGFDEDFFLYGEDLDICLRVRKAGYEIGYCDSVLIDHVGAYSEKKTDWYERETKKQKGIFLFYKKHYPQSRVIEIAKNEQRRSRWRKLFHDLKFKLFGREYSKNKALRYKAIFDVTNEVLKH